MNLQWATSMDDVRIGCYGLAKIGVESLDLQ